MKATRYQDTDGRAIDRPREVPRADDRQATVEQRMAAGPRETIDEAAAPRRPATQPKAATRREPDRAQHSADLSATGAEPAPTLEHSPGEVNVEPSVRIWPDGAPDGLRERWRELQLHFVDDPRQAAAGADAVLAETIGILNDSLQAAREDLSEWRSRDGVDTEGLRIAIQRYRTVLDRVLAL